MTLSDNHSLKRTSSTAQFDEPAAKKLNRGHIRHHKASWDLQREQRHNGTALCDGDAQTLLTRSIGLALEAVGFEAAAPEAMDSFRGDVEKCMEYRCKNVLSQLYTDYNRHVTLSCRRATIYAFLSPYNTYTSGLPTVVTHTSTQP